MSAMLKEILRWHNSVPRQRPAERWQSWARSLNERYGHISQRHSGMSMTLIQPPALLYSCSQRWEQVAWNLFPQIKLAIHPILQQTVWHAINRPVMIQRMPNLKPLEYSGGRTTNQTPALRPKGVSNPRQEEGANSIKQLLKSEELSFSWRAPLRRVFSRISIEHLDEELITLQAHRKNLVAEQSEKIVRRVLDERQRVETRMTPQALVIRRQPEMPSVVAKTESRPMVINSQWGSKVGIDGMHQPFAPQTIDIERLTDQVVRQIDQKIVAHRERMGRLF